MSNNDDTGRTLDGRPAEPLPSTWARQPSNQRVGRIGNWTTTSSSGTGRFATIDSMNSASSGGPVRPAPVDNDEEEAEEDDDADRGESWFAGGERSGISIENPDRQRAVPGGDMVRELLRRAAEGGPPPPPSNIFSGGGHRLGSDEEPSTYVPDPNAEPPEQEGTAVRHITFWRNGFTVEDGELMHYDDPANAQILSEINAGRAPPSILNVLVGQPVELRVAKRTTEDYIPPRIKAFSGAGHRLGAPVPTFTGTDSQASVMPGSFPAPSSGARQPEQRESISTRFEVDQTLPMTSIQLRLADGTRMVCRMNLTHTVQDIRNFINASRPENLSRVYTIGTTFPNRTLEDSTQTIEAAGLTNSVVVQRWV